MTAEQIAAGLTKAQRDACLAGRAWYPRCRDCADEDGFCPGFHNWPCDGRERQHLEDEVRRILQEIPDA